MIEGQDREKSASTTSFPTMNPERYLPLVSEMELTDEQAQELLQVIWNIMCGFVELGFGSNSIQRILPSILGEFPEAARNDVHSTHSNKTTSALQPGGDDARDQ